MSRRTAVVRRGSVRAGGVLYSSAMSAISSIIIG
jgi:hypothetical protein